MVAVMSQDRLNAAWTKLARWAVGLFAAKSVDACALYWGKVAAINGAKVDVTLDTQDIPSPSGVPLLLGLPASAVDGIEGQRVLVGYRNGDLSQPYALLFEFNAAASAISIGTNDLQPAARATDPVQITGGAYTAASLTLAVKDGNGVSGTLTITVAGGVLVVTPAGGPGFQTPGGTYTQQGTITDGSDQVSIGTN
jgi:hypothetical protein